MLYEFRSERKENLDYMEEQFRSLLAQGASEGMDITCRLIGERPCQGEVDPVKAEALLERAIRAVVSATGQTPQWLLR